MGRRRPEPEGMSPEEENTSAEMSPTGSDTAFYSDKKKQTHLRCERQRREAINNGYSDLKDLIPQTASAMGCKTTNAAILFRACDHMNQLMTEVDNGEKEVQQLQAQAAALEMICAQYESMAADTPSASSTSLQAAMLQILLEDSFASFVDHVDFTSYGNITRTLLTWVETLSMHNERFRGTATKLVTLPYKHISQ